MRLSFKFYWSLRKAFYIGFSQLCTSANFKKKSVLTKPVCTQNQIDTRTNLKNKIFAKNVMIYGTQVLTRGQEISNLLIKWFLNALFFRKSNIFMLPLQNHDAG
jgi:hypothetical protein